MSATSGHRGAASTLLVPAGGSRRGSRVHAVGSRGQRSPGALRPPPREPRALTGESWGAPVLPPALKHARLEEMREKGKWSGKDKDGTGPTVLRKKDSEDWACFVRVDQEERNKRSNVNSTLRALVFVPELPPSKPSRRAPMAPPASLVLLVFSLLVALTATAAAADEEAGQNCSPVSCGGVNITYPFAIVPGEAIETSCGAIGFQVRCENDTPYLGYKNSLYGHQFQILHISYDNASLVIADVHKLHHFNGSDANSCHAPSNNSSNKLGLPFSISPMNKNLIFYNCEKPLPETVRRSEGLAETTCGNRTFVRVAAERSDDSSGSYSNYFLEGCEATVVPALARSGGAVNASNYKELISGGFLLTWQAPSPSPPMKSGQFHSLK